MNTVRDKDLSYKYLHYFREEQKWKWVSDLKLVLTPIFLVI